MKLKEFTHYLSAAPNRALCFLLPDGDAIEAHAHVTEVGRIDKSFIDCGGTIRRSAHVCLQTWVADDVDHRLALGRLAEIVAKAAPILGTDDLDVEIEYEGRTISQYPVERAEVTSEALTFHLGSKHTDCLAKELCVPAGVAEAACCSGGSCG
jgi:hypothetical protein